MTPISRAVALTLPLLLLASNARADGADLTVVGSKETETGGSVHSVKRKQLERFKFDDPHAVFLGVPGVYARGEDGVGLRPNIGIRGASSDRSKKVTLMEDGVLIAPAPYSAPAAYYFPLIGRMRSVRVFKGPSAVVFGPQTVGGAIDMISEDIPATPSGMFDFAYGSFGYTKLHARHGLSDDRAGLLIEGMHLGTTGFKQLDGGPVSGSGGNDTGFLRREWMLKGSLILYRTAAVQHELGLKGIYSGESSNETYLGLSDGDFRNTPYRRYLASKLDHMDWHRTSLALTHRMRAGDFELTTTAYRSDMHRTWKKVNAFAGSSIDDVFREPNTAANRVYLGVLKGELDAPGFNQTLLIGPNDRSYLSQGIQTNARATSKGATWENRLDYGVRLHFDQITRLHSQDGYVMTGGQLVRDNRPTQFTADNTASTTAIALYAADAFAWKRLIITPGIRVELFRSREHDRLRDRVTIGHHAVVLPALGSYFAITKSLGLLGGVSRGFSPPPAGSSSKPEDSINWEGGVRLTEKKIRIEAIGFFNDYQNLTNNCTFSGGCTAANQDQQFDAGGVWVYGGEAFVESELKTKIGITFPARLAYTYTQSQLLSSFDSGDPTFGRGQQEGQPLPYVPRHQLAVTLGVEGDRAGIAAQAMYVGAMRESGDPRDPRSTDAFATFDVSGYVKLTKWLQIYANVRNLTDQRYLVGRRPFGARPGAPRWLQVGLKIDL